jgi:hypothetical protein
VYFVRDLGVYGQTIQVTKKVGVFVRFRALTSTTQSQT